MSILETDSWVLGPAGVGPPFDSRPPLCCFNKGVLSPADLYCYLKARFGDPNGFAMVLKQPGSANLIHWEYTLSSGLERLDIVGVASRVEFRLWCDTSVSEDMEASLLSAIKQDFSVWGEQMSRVRKSLERWRLFINPYRRLERIVSEYADRLRALKVDDVEFPSFPRTREQIEAFYPLMKELTSKFNEASYLGTSLRMITPVWGESFVNALAFLLAKPEVRSNKRIYENFIRKEIDIRIASLQMHCDGLERPVDMKHDSVRGFRQVMDNRNDLLHGNVDPKALFFEELYFDGDIPLFKREQYLAERGLRPLLQKIEPAQALEDVDKVSTFCCYVLSCLRPDVKGWVEAYLKDLTPGWREDTGRVGLLFPDAVADIFMSVADESEE